MRSYAFARPPLPCLSPLRARIHLGIYTQMDIPFNASLAYKIFEINGGDRGKRPTALCMRVYIPAYTRAVGASSRFLYRCQTGTVQYKTASADQITRGKWHQFIAIQ